MEREAKKGFLINFAYYAVIICIIAFLCRLMLKYLLPFVLATVIAYLMQRPAEALAKRTKIGSGVCAAILSALFYISVIGLLGFLLYRIAFYLGGAFEDLVKYISRLGTLVQDIKALPIFADLPEDFSKTFDTFFENMLGSIASSLTEYISGFASALAKSMPSFLLSSVVALVASCYIAKDYKGLTKFLKSLCGKRIYQNVLKVKQILIESVFRLGKGYLLLMALTYAELIIGFVILKIEHAPLIALVVALIDILPVLGVGTVLLPWAVFEILFASARRGIGLALLYLVTVLVRNFAEPKVIGGQIGIDPLFTLFAMFVGLKLFGVTGLIILPVTLIVVIKYYKNEMDNEDRLSD